MPFCAAGFSERPGPVPWSTRRHADRRDCRENMEISRPASHISTNWHKPIRKKLAQPGANLPASCRFPSTLSFDLPPSPLHTEGLPLSPSQPKKWTEGVSSLDMWPSSVRTCHQSCPGSLTRNTSLKPRLLRGSPPHSDE